MLDGLRRELHERVDHDFSYHQPPNPGIAAIYTAIRSGAKMLAHQAIDMAPPGRELSTALTKLEEFVMFANAAVARHPDGACNAETSPE